MEREKAVNDRRNLVHGGRYQVAAKRTCRLFQRLNGYGHHYHDVYERQDNQWRIESIALTRLLVEPTARIPI